ncbi:MAG: ABC transporter permease, partial [Acidobacteria bacterium]|nr:ABC transporter permease [Acidobacteriota bacterium]
MTEDTGKRSVAPPVRARLRAAGLALPLVAFVGVSFLFPLGTMLSRSVYDPLVADTLPQTLALLAAWDGEIVPGEPVFAAAAQELETALDGRLA